MKKVIGIMILVLLCGCSMAGDHLTSEQYDEVTLARYEESASLTLYEGENFEAKLVLFDRYVNENNELYYECRILIKPLMEMNGKDLQVQLKPNEAQERYYSADQSQRMFQTMHYPIKKTADQYDCIEFMYRLGSHGFLEMQQAQWEEAMNEISLELSYGAVKETITFACEPVTTYSKNEENISAVLYYGVIREE
ncbi:MAG TPA: hypothetical protein IAC88_03140 [Candidatus Onthosoma merdavium]|nr:hypothetical protein [Candidatus Onthosoma merdavium]